VRQLSVVLCAAQRPGSPLHRHAHCIAHAAAWQVLSTSSAKLHAAAMHELAVLQQLAPLVAPDAGQQPDGPAGAAAARTSSHLVQLLDALLVPQHSHKPRATSAKGSASAALDHQGASPDGAAAAAVVLVLAPLHQSLAWVLHWVQQRWVACRVRCRCDGGLGAWEASWGQRHPLTPVPFALLRHIHTCRHGRSGLPPSAVRSLAHQLLSGLAELHDGQSLVHRDVKPSNVLLQQPFVVRTRKVRPHCTPPLVSGHCLCTHCFVL
jgi:hypothetical protein